MSVNFYARGTGCPDGEGLHIGQSAGDWEFLFRAHPDRGLVDAPAWHGFLSAPGVSIYAEFGYRVALDEVWPDMIRRPADVGGPNRMRSRFNRYPTPREGEWRDRTGCPFADYEFC